MSELRLTAGRWKFRPAQGKMHAHIVANGIMLAIFKTAVSPPDGRAMAAAPDLLAVTLKVINDVDPVCMIERDHPQAGLADLYRAALAARDLAYGGDPR